MAQLRQNLKIMKLTELCRNTFQQRVKERDRSWDTEANWRLLVKISVSTGQVWSRNKSVAGKGKENWCTF